MYEGTAMVEGSHPYLVEDLHLMPFGEGVLMKEWPLLAINY